jgi:hypothetical protein
MNVSDWVKTSFALLWLLQNVRSTGRKKGDSRKRASKTSSLKKERYYHVYVKESKTDMPLSCHDLIRTEEQSIPQNTSQTLPDNIASNSQIKAEKKIFHR